MSQGLLCGFKVLLKTLTPFTSHQERPPHWTWKYGDVWCHSNLAVHPFAPQPTPKPCTVRAPHLQWKRKENRNSALKAEWKQQEASRGTSLGLPKARYGVPMHYPYPKCADCVPNLGEVGRGFLPI